MSRRIITQSLQASDGRPADTYLDRVIKNIPSDIVGAWVAAMGIISTEGSSPNSTLLWVIFVVGLVLTPIWTWRQTSEPNKPIAKTQIMIATLAFFVWVFALGGPFATLEFYKPQYGSLLLIFFTLIVALIVPKEE